VVGAAVSLGPWQQLALASLSHAHAHAHTHARTLPPPPTPTAENLLIDSQGYLKMVDFGFAKTVKDRTYTVCGTPEYLSPELVLGKAHGPGVDYWALGILLFEQVAGYSPFCDAKGNDQMVICRNILKAEPEFPAHVKDKDCKDLILSEWQAPVRGGPQAVSRFPALQLALTHSLTHCPHLLNPLPTPPHPTSSPLCRAAHQGRHQAPGVHGGGGCRGQGPPLLQARGLEGAARQAAACALAAHLEERPGH
jgi:serine/threonine protein kinase